MAPDILDCIKRDFPATDVPGVIEQIELASDSPRVQRCIVFAARGHPWYLDFLRRQAKTDWRDVIFAAEYAFEKRLYDFNKPISKARLQVHRSRSPNVPRKRQH